MFFVDSSVVARAKRNVLELYFPPKNQFYKLEIPQNAVNFLDVTNEDYLIKYVFDFLIKTNKKSAKVELVMDSEVVFEKTIPRANEESDLAVIEEFFSSVPLAPGNIARKTYISNGQYLLYATNKSYFNSIIRAFAKFGWRVNYVAPLSIFGISVQNQVLGDDSLKRIRKDKKLALKINFLEENLPKSK